MEIGHNGLYYAECIARRNHYACVRMYPVEPLGIQPLQQCRQGLNGRQGMLTAIRLPLPNAQFALLNAGVPAHLLTQEVEALQCAHRCSTHGNSRATGSNKALNQAALHLNILLVHLVVGYQFALHRLERSCTNVQCNLAALHTGSIQRTKHCRSKVQACGGRRHRALHL